jgi:hypothetical protein
MDLERIQYVLSKCADLFTEKGTSSELMVVYISNPLQ